MGEFNRRQFLKKGAMKIAVTSTCLCSINGCATITKIGNTPSINPDSFTLTNNILTIDLSKEVILSKVGGAIKIKHSDIPNGVIIAHVDEQRFEVASLLCTHRGVEVEYDQELTNFNCASLGGSTYGIDGKNLSGPASKPLREFEAALKDGILTIKI